MGEPVDWMDRAIDFGFGALLGAFASIPFFLCMIDEWPLITLTISGMVIVLCGLFAFRLRDRLWERFAPWIIWLGW